MRHTTAVGGLIEGGAEPKGEAASLAGCGKPRFAIVLRRRGYLSVRHRAIGPRPTGINRRPTVASSSGSALRLVII